MKRRIWTALFLALLLLVPARALAAEPEAFPPGRETSVSPEETPASGNPENAALTVVSEEGPNGADTPKADFGDTESLSPEPPPDPEPGGIFQLGFFEGPQTIPGQPAPRSADWESQVYETILAAWRQRKPEADVRDLNITAKNWEAFWDVLRAVINDHPELFYADWYSGTGRWNNGQLMTLELQYHPCPIGLEEAIQRFTEAENEAMALVADVTDEAETALILHDWLALRCGYNREAARALWQGTWQDFHETTDNTLMWTAYGALVNGDPVCQGYALGYKRLLSLAGIDSLYLSAKEMNHGWNAVNIDGQWYHADVTWDDSTPDTEGACRHFYFLLSDETMGDSDHGHYGWPELVTCGSKRFEEGWAFNGVELPIYRRDGSFYYLDTVEETVQLSETYTVTAEITAVFKTDALNEAGTRLPVSLGKALPGGAVWLEDRLYLCPYAYLEEPERLLLAYDLDTGVLVQAGRFPHTPAPSADGHYSAGLDRQPGLRYRGGSIEAVSPTSGGVIASFPARSLSGSWLELTEEETAIAPELSPDGGAAVLTPAPPGASLWAAFYREGRFVAARRAGVQEKYTDLNAFYITPPMVTACLDMDGLPAYDAVRLMLLAEDFLPLCPAAPDDGGGGDVNQPGDGTDAPIGGGVNRP